MIILKDAYVLTFNRNNDFGRYSLLINGSKVTDMADDSARGISKTEKWIEQHQNNAEIIDCSNKLILPPLVNSCLRSEGTLLHYLLKRRHYEKADEDICTDLIFNYLYQEMPGEIIKNDLQNIYNYSYSRSIKSGTGFLNEFSLRKDTAHLPLISGTIKKTGQKLSVCYPIKQDVNTLRDFKYLNPSFYVTQENFLTVYDISGITELKNHNLRDLFLEVAVNKEVTDQFRQNFHKSVVALFDEYGLIDAHTTFINPLYLDYNDLKIITDRKANIIVCPRDLAFFTSRYFPIDDYIGHGIKFSLGTGWLGEDLLKDLRFFRNKYKELNLSSTELLNSVTKMPYSLYFESEHDGESSYVVDINKPATFSFVDFSDSRFRFYPEDFSFESVCDFLVDNLTSYNFSDVMIDGEFRVRNSKLSQIDEKVTEKDVNETRNRLYKTGKYDELKRKQQSREITEKLDMKGRTDDEIKLFSEVSDEITDEENNEEFRIKTKIPVFRQKKNKDQKSLFEEFEHVNIIQSDEFQNTPALNLLITDQESVKSVDEELVKAKNVDETIIKRLTSEKPQTTASKNVNTESKIELPKNVKLKFGDD